MSQGPADFGSGALSSISSTIYWYLVLGILFILVTAPGAVPAMFLERHLSNAPLYALFLAPVGPALSAMLFAHARRSQAEDVTPARYFFRGYRLNLLDSLKVWLPATVLILIMTINLAFVEATGFGNWYVVVGVLIALFIVTLTLTQLVMVSLFKFRLSDVWRLSLGWLFSRPLQAAGILGVAVISGLIIVITFDAVLLLLASPLAALLLRMTQPLQDDLRQDYLEGNVA
ncbi:MAG TPA: DUF624 domain-containing protein [Tessaracoccus flavescens]|uniref:DUF624 domain-containing protein n=1 Tax=Tessaracoccus flavescens TaxID=399497 RepID=A0A921EKZ4_9ACTN|nr:DUF624 domain-containing protein [Tessaracoccus flavescens]